MDFRPKNYYQVPSQAAVVEEESGSFEIYHRKEDGSLGQLHVGKCDSHKDAILTVKEALVAEGDCLTNKAVLAVIKGGKA